MTREAIILSNIAVGGLSLDVVLYTKATHGGGVA